MLTWKCVARTGTPDPERAAAAPPTAPEDRVGTNTKQRIQFFV